MDCANSLVSYGIHVRPHIYIQRSHFHVLTNVLACKDMVRGSTLELGYDHFPLCRLDVSGGVPLESVRLLDRSACSVLYSPRLVSLLLCSLSPSTSPYLKHSLPPLKFPSCPSLSTALLLQCFRPSSFDLSLFPCQTTCTLHPVTVRTCLQQLSQFHQRITLVGVVPHKRLPFEVGAERC